ncbi:hypothetical protein ACQ4LE_000065 [Meloidogyne hapla]
MAQQDVFALICLMLLFGSTISLLYRRLDICEEGEEFKECASICEPKCSDLGHIPPLIGICMPGECQCKEGYARNDKKICIPKEDCFKSTTEINDKRTTNNY